MKTTAVISGRSPPDPVPRNGSNAHRHGPRRPAPGQPARTVSRARRGAATPCGSAAPGVARCEIRRTCGRRSGLFHVARAARPTPACAPRSPGAATERRPILTEATHRCRLSAPTRRLEGRQLSTPAQGTRRGSDQTVFDKFSDQARHVVVLASDPASTHHHNHLGGEHLLTGVHAAGGPTLTSWGITGPRIDTALDEIPAYPNTDPGCAGPPFTPTLKRPSPKACGKPPYSDTTPSAPNTPNPTSRPAHPSDILVVGRSPGSGGSACRRSANGTCRRRSRRRAGGLRTAPFHSVMISLVGEYGSLLRVRSEPTTTKCRAGSSCSPAPISGPSPSHCLTRPAVSGSGCSPQSPRTPLPYSRSFTEGLRSPDPV